MKVVAMTRGELFEFVRNMDYVLGKAFEITCNNSQELDTNPESELNQLIVDALTWRPGNLHPQLHAQLKRKLVMRAAQFDDDVFLLLQCLLEAAAGDYSLLNVYARQFKVLPSNEAYSLYFDIDEEEAA